MISKIIIIIIIIIVVACVLLPTIAARACSILLCFIVPLLLLHVVSFALSLFLSCSFSRNSCRYEICCLSERKWLSETTFSHTISVTHSHTHTYMYMHRIYDVYEYMTYWKGRSSNGSCNEHMQCSIQHAYRPCTMRYSITSSSSSWTYSIHMVWNVRVFFLSLVCEYARWPYMYYRIKYKIGRLHWGWMPPHPSFHHKPTIQCNAMHVNLYAINIYCIWGIYNNNNNSDGSMWLRMHYDCCMPSTMVKFRATHKPYIRKNYISRCELNSI